MTPEYEQYRIGQARAYLVTIRDARKHIAALEAKAAAIRESADGLRGIDYSRDMVSTSPTADAIPNAVASLEAIANSAAECAASVASDITECEVCLQSLGGWKADLLTLHYMCGKTLVDIGEMDGWKHDRQYMSVLHLQALAEFYYHMPHYRREPIERAI